MNRIILIVLLFASQAITAQNQVALFAGPQMSTANYSIRNQKQETGFKYGLHAGIGMKVPFDGFLYFAPSVYYSYKGYDVTYNLPNSLNLRMCLLKQGRPWTLCYSLKKNLILSEVAPSAAI